MNYYNEWEKFPAQWLRELANDGLIPEGVVDERSITELRPEDLAGYDQAHFFAGIGGWPRAIELAGIPADFPIWSGSCPCQPFSTAGKRSGAADERNLWHIWFELIRVCRPNVVVGEQVASAIAVGWLDRVLDDLESAGYETWACVLPACSVGAPHIRSRLFWAGVRRFGNADGQQAHSAIEGQSMSCAGLPVGGVALPVQSGSRDNGGAARGQGGAAVDPGPKGIRSDNGKAGTGGPEPGGPGGGLENSYGERPSSQQALRSPRCPDSTRARGPACGLGDTCLPGSARFRKLSGESVCEDEADGHRQAGGGAASDAACGLGDSQQPRLEGHAGDEQHRDEPGRVGAGTTGSTSATGHWADALPILCRDGKTRRVPAPQPGIFGLAHGLPEGMDLGWAESAFPLAGKIEGRVGLLKGYGNAIVPQVAAAFLRAVLV